MKKEFKNQNQLTDAPDNENDIHYLQNISPLRKKLQRSVSFLTAFFSFLFGVCYINEIKKTINTFCLSIGIDLPLLGRVILILIGLAAFIVIDTFIHEMIHIVACGNKMKYCKVNFDCKGNFAKWSVWVECDCWFAKSHDLFIQIAPFVFFEIIAVTVGIIANSMFWFLFITLVNFIGSSYDLFWFFYFLFMTPSGCFINGNAYRHQ